MANKLDRGNAQTDRLADIVFCIDSTGSMKPCFDGMKANLNNFIVGLDKYGAVNWRFRLVGYRDYHDPSAKEKWDIFDFTDSKSEFLSQLSSVIPFGGGDAPESTLDALYISVTSEWRGVSNLQRVVVLLTDADSHATISPRTYSRPDNDIERIIQEFQTLTHSMLFMIAPKFPIYKQISERMTRAKKKVIFDPLPINSSGTGIDSKYLGLENVDFGMMLKVIAESISSSFSV
jgi:hypothetical protein